MAATTLDARHATATTDAPWTPSSAPQMATPAVASAATSTATQPATQPATQRPNPAACAPVNPPERPGHPPRPGTALPVLEPRPVPPPLTQCPDLRSAAGLLEAGLGRCRRQARLATVLWVDMVLGELDTSRSLMQAMGQRLRHRVRATDAVMQVGCEGFAVLLVDAGEQASAVVRERLREALQQPYRVGEGRCAPLMLRVGRAVHGLDGQDAQALLRVAARLGAADL